MSDIAAVFLDRDGVIVLPEFRDGRSYAPTRLDAFHIYPDIEPSLAALKAAGFLIIVVTNQPDVGRGIISRDTIDAMHDRLSASLPIDEIRMCEHVREDACDCRKPRPGMLLDAARAHGVNLARSFMVGDRDSDVAAGKLAGCRTIHIDLNYEAEPAPINPDWSVASLQEAARVILDLSAERKM